MFQTIEEGLQEYRELLLEYREIRQRNEGPSYLLRELWVQSLARCRKVLGMTEEESREINQELGIQEAWLNVNFR